MGENFQVLDLPEEDEARLLVSCDRVGHTETGTIRSLCRELLLSGRRSLVVDLSACRYVSSSAISEIVNFRDRAGAETLNVVVCCTGVVAEIFRQILGGTTEIRVI